MKNPWIEITENYNSYKDERNFILKEDRNIINEFNCKNKEVFQIKEYILPFPFLGNVENSEILILLNNPGFDEEELKKGYYDKFHSEIKDSYQGNQKMYCFEDEYIQYSDYWNKKLGNLIEKFGKRTIAEKISIVNFFPYSSSRYKDFSKRDKSNFLKNGYLHSQIYNFEIVKNAMDRKALIIIVRGRKNWFKAVDGLESYINTFKTNSYLNSSITKNNCRDFFDKILERLNKKKCRLKISSKK